MKRRVALLLGGRSAEHEISVLSARSVAQALDPERYEVLAIGITREGVWRLLPELPAPAEGGALPGVPTGSGTEIVLDQEPGSGSLVDAEGSRTPIDVVFPVLHGPFGEDGSIQGFLEMAGVPYVGSGVLGSAVGMDKAVQKVLFRAAGLEVAPHEVVHERQWEEDPEGVEARALALGFPQFAKPAALGSSVGISRLDAPAELRAALELAFRYGRKALLEHAVQDARELEVAVLGNDDPVASVAGEIVPRGHPFYDYEAKYVDERGAELIIPAEVEPEVLEALQRTAIAAFRAIDAAGMARVDFFLRPEGRVVVNEVNTIPGFTSISMYPRLWEASGLTFPALVDRLVELAIERHEAERKRGTVD